MIVGLQRGDTRRRVIYFCSSSISLSYVKHQKNNKNSKKCHMSINKPDEDSFDSPLNIQFHLKCHILKLKKFSIY